MELEKFDHGGVGVAWDGGTKAKGPRADSGIMLFPLEEREWIIWAKAEDEMTYTVNVAQAGIYRPVLDAANRGREQGAKRLHLSHKASGQRVSFAVTPTGSNTDWIGFATEGAQATCWHKLSSNYTAKMETLTSTPSVLIKSTKNGI